MTAREEQETVIRFSPSDPMAHVWTSHPATARKMERAKVKPVLTSYRAGEAVAWSYSVPLDSLRWKVGKRRVSEEQRRAAAERLAAARAAKKKVA